MSRTKLALLRIFAWFHLFGVPALVTAAGSASTDVSNLARPTGRVTLFSFERGVLRTVTDGIDTEVVLTAPPKYFEAYLFECNATYPVQWAYIGEAAPVVTADVGRFFKDFYDINTYTYQSIMLMYSLQEMQSGRYICRGASKEHDKLAIHYDVFVPGNGTQILLSTKEKKLFIPENKEHAYIPCGVSDSTSVVNLYRGNQWGTFYPVPVNGSITFNPRKGFKIRFKDFLDPWGTYLCVSSSNKRRRKVHLIPESLKAKYDLINHVNGKIPVYFSYEYEYNRILCCTGTNFIPKLQWAGCGSILDCQVKSACFEEERCEQRLGNSGYNPSKWIDPGPLPPGCSGYRLRDDPNGDFGLFKCSTPGIAQYQPYLLNRGNIFLDFEKTPPSEMILTLQRISPEGPSFVGDEVEFHCNSTRFYFAYGIRWGWEKLMGEIEFIDDATVIRDKYSVRGHRRRTTFRIPHSDIKAIICFVPVVNSATEWRTVSLPMVIAASDVNYIQNPTNAVNPNPANNVIDLDSITYHTDYDTPVLDPNTVNQGHIQQQQPQQQLQALQPETPHVAPAPTIPHTPPPQHNANNNAVFDSQKFVSTKAVVQEFHSVVPVEQHDNPNQFIETNPYYNFYAHDSSVEQPQQQVIITNHPHSQIPQNSHSHNVHPLQKPQTADVFASAAHTPANIPDIIQISKHHAKTRSKTTSPTKSVPNLKTEPPHYDTITTLVENPPVYDTYEPRPSSSISSNSRLHKSHSSPSHKMRTSSTRIPHQHQTHTTTLVANKRPPTFPHRIRNNNNIFHDEILYSSPKKSYRDYNNFNDAHLAHHGVSDSMRLSLPFEPNLPNMGRGRYAHGSNHSHVRQLPLRTTSTMSSSQSHRSNSRRPSSHSHSPPVPVQMHHSSSRKPHHHHHHNHHQHHAPHGVHHHGTYMDAKNEEEKEYTLDESYSQHVRLSLPTKTAATQPQQHLPKSQKANRNRQTGQGHGRSSTKSHHISNHNANNDDVYYYATDDDSPVEIKVPRMKAHESHSSRAHHYPHHNHHHSPSSHHHHQKQSSHNHSPSHTIINDDMETNIEQVEPYQSSPTTYLKRKPSSSGDFYVRPTSQTYVHEGLEDGASSSNIGNHHHNNNHHALPQSQHHTSSSSSPSSSSSSTRSQNHGKSHQIQFVQKSSSSGRRSHSRNFRFNANTLANGEIVTEAYEFTSPTARPAYYVSAENQQQHHHSNNHNHHINHNHHHSTEEKNESGVQNSSTELNIKAAEMDLKRVEPRIPSTQRTFRPSMKPKNNNNNSSEILHSVSISISSKITHSREDPDTAAGDVKQVHLSPLTQNVHHQVIEDKSNEGEEIDDYDTYSPKFTNYRKSTTPSSIIPHRQHVPIQFFHVKPNDIGSFMPAKSIIDEEDEDEFGKK